MIKYLYYSVLILLVGCCAACTRNEDGDVHATDLDLDWFVVSDDYDNPIDSLRYEIFKQHRVPVYYDDTIGCMDRGEKDRAGNTVLFYRVIRPDYTITGYNSNLSWQEVENKEELETVLNVLLHHTFDKYPVQLLPRCLYLVRKLDARTGGILSFLHAMECGVVNIDDRFLKTDETSLAAEGITLKCEMGAGALEKFYEDELEYDFYAISRNLYNSIYSQSLANFVSGENGAPKDLYKEGDDPRKFGFMRYSATKVQTAAPRMVNKEEDARDFIKLILTKTLEEVQEEHEAYPLVIQKYEAMKRIWEMAIEH